MKILAIAVVGCALLANACAADNVSRLTPEMQTVLDAQKRIIAGWAADSVLVNAVKAQNKKVRSPE